MLDDGLAEYRGPELQAPTFMASAVTPEAGIGASEITDLSTKTLPSNGQVELTRTPNRGKYVTLAFTAQSDYYGLDRWDYPAHMRCEEMVEDLIFAEDLHKTFNGLKAVDGISFRMSRGECFGILGPNGAGKTTTVRMIYGFSPVSSGTLEVFGMDINKHARLIKAKSGVCQQENNLDPDLTVFQNLVTYASYFDIPRATAKNRASELLRFMGLEHKEQAKILELSGGMQRRLVIARALINNPELLILDEPTTGLDPQSRHQVWGRLAELKAQGLGILLTTHYMEEAAHLCDRLVIMDHGRILVEGGPVELIHQNVGANVIEIESPSETLLTYVEESDLDWERLSHRLLIYTRDGETLFRKISESFCDRGCSLRMATLEDVFLKLTGRELRD